MKKIEITSSQARRGTQVKLRRPDGRLILVKIPSNTKDGTKLSISGQEPLWQVKVVKDPVDPVRLWRRDEEPEVHRKTAQPNAEAFPVDGRDGFADPLETYRLRYAELIKVTIEKAERVSNADYTWRLFSFEQKPKPGRKFGYKKFVRRRQTMWWDMAKQEYALHRALFLAAIDVSCLIQTQPTTYDFDSYGDIHNRCEESFEHFRDAVIRHLAKLDQPQIQKVYRLESSVAWVGEARRFWGEKMHSWVGGYAQRWKPMSEAEIESAKLGRQQNLLHYVRDSLTLDSSSLPCEWNGSPFAKGDGAKDFTDALFSDDEITTHRGAIFRLEEWARKAGIQLEDRAYW